MEGQERHLLQTDTDLLPPLFDQILIHYGCGVPGAYTRASLVQALRKGIINAAADAELPAAMKSGYQRDTSKKITLTTEVRLSGGAFPRVKLTELLETAVPLDWSLIEPFLPQKASDDHIRVLHISDLHLTENLVHPEQAKSHILWQKRHDPKMLMRLSQAIDGLNPAFELLAVTGDLTGDGSRESFDSASQYIQEGPIKGRNTKRSPLWGINAKRGSFVLWPGNHDRYSGNHGHHIGVRLPLQRLDGRFEEYFALPKKQPDYPYVVGFKSQRTNDAELTLLLFVFDSGLIDPRMEASLYRRIAYGQITDGEIIKLNKLSQTVSEGNVDDLFGTAMHITPDNTIRIALLHHHPVTSFEIEKKEEEQRRHPFKSFFCRAKESGCVDEL